MKKIFIVILSFIIFQNICFASSIKVNIIPSESVTPHQTDVIMNAVNSTTEYMQLKYGKKLGQNVKIYVGTDSSEVPKMFSANDINQNIGGKSTLGTIKIVIPEQATDYYITFLTAHEMIHQYQAIILGGSDVLKKNMWFTEGMADMIGVEIANPINPKMHKVFKRNAEQSANTCLLSNITKKRDWDRLFANEEKTYARADAAMIYLYENYPHNYMFLYLSELFSKNASDALNSVYGLTIKDLDDILDGKYQKELNEEPMEMQSSDDLDFIVSEHVW